MRIWLLVIALLLTACGAPQSCAKQSPEFAKSLNSIMQEWQDATKLAGSTPRAALSVQIATLQSIRRKTQDLEAPECGKAAQTALTKAMDANIDAFTAFLGQATDDVVNAKFTVATLALQNAATELAKLAEVPK